MSNRLSITNRWIEFKNWKLNPWNVQIYSMIDISHSALITRLEYGGNKCWNWWWENGYVGRFNPGTKFQVTCGKLADIENPDKSISSQNPSISTEANGVYAPLKNIQIKVIRRWSQWTASGFNGEYLNNTAKTVIPTHEKAPHVIAHRRP